MLHLDSNLEKMKCDKGENECEKHFGRDCFFMTCQVISSGRGGSSFRAA